MVISSQHDCYKIPTIFLGHNVISILPQEEHEILRFYSFYQFHCDLLFVFFHRHVLS